MPCVTSGFVDAGVIKGTLAFSNIGAAERVLELATAPMPATTCSFSIRRDAVFAASTLSLLSSRSISFTGFPSTCGLNSLAIFRLSFAI